MTLEEKMYFDCTLTPKEDAIRKTKIAEDFAIGFAMHISTHCYCELGNDTHSYQELLEIYKKESQL